MRSVVVRTSIVALCACGGAESPIRAPGNASPQTTQEVLDSAKPSDWRTPKDESLLYMWVGEKLVVMELAEGLAAKNIENLMILVAERYFDHTKIVRSQDNYVVQWADEHAEDDAKKRPLGSAKERIPPEFWFDGTPGRFVALPDGDVYAEQVGWLNGFPAARNGKQSWLAHCYGALGVARDVAHDTGNGSQLYVVTGHSPRHLDRQITLLGRVIWGMEHLASLPRGTGPLGFYENTEQRISLKLRRAVDVPADQRVALKILRTDTALFPRFVEARRNRREEWFASPVGKIELCNVPLPVQKH